MDGNVDKGAGCCSIVLAFLIAAFLVWYFWPVIERAKAIMEAAGRL